MKTPTSPLIAATLLYTLLCLGADGKSGGPAPGTNAPPLILSQPPRQVFAQEAMPLELRVVATDPNDVGTNATDQLLYQWKRDGTNLTSSVNALVMLKPAPLSKDLQSLVQVTIDNTVSLLQGQTARVSREMHRPQRIVPHMPRPGADAVQFRGEDYLQAVAAQTALVFWLPIVQPETNTAYFIPAVSTNDVGTYELVITGAAGLAANSEPIHLSVYRRTVGSNGGTLTTPIGAFTALLPPQNPGQGTYNRKYVYAPFDGPYKSAPVSYQFPNPASYPALRVQTDRAASYLQILDEPYSGYPPRAQGTQSCEYQTMGANKQYRVAVYVNSPPTGNVLFTWTYDHASY